jgi:predicted CoA-substrate-specific enzyme activase
MITAGLDIGLRYVKAVILNDWKLVGFAIAPANNDHEHTANTVLSIALKMAGLERSDIDYTIATGYGRNRISFANETISEISANARGVQWLGLDSDVHIIIDLGAHDTKVIAVDEEYNIQSFVMNDRYEAGMGQFIEELARALELPIDHVSELSLNSCDPLEITSSGLEMAKCEVGYLFSNGHKKEDIVAGIYHAVARRLVAMVKRVGVKGPIIFDGGSAKNIGIIKALETELGMKVHVPENPQLIAATGATLIAAERFIENGS